jgi:hypothetical protein
MDFQEFIDWQHKVSNAFLHPRHNSAVLEGLEYSFSAELNALVDITEIENIELRVQMGHARELGLI